MSDGSFCHYCRRAECICPDSLAAQAAGEEARRTTELPKPTGAVWGRCFDINGDTWHHGDYICTKCGFGYPQKAEVKK